MNWSQQLLWVAGISLAAMILLWLIQIATRKVALVDVGWSSLLGGSFVFYALTGDGSESRRWIGGTMGGLWALRLGSHMLVNRVLAKHEDGRYAQWRIHLGRRFQPVMLAFFVAQAVSIPLLAAPHLINAHNPAPLGPLDAAAIALFIIGQVGVFISDHQLESFKSDPANRGKVCNIRLWRFSRHPNYFFEWLTWVAYALLAALAPSGWLGWTAAILMLLLILKVSGIPPAEKQSLRSRGEAYRRYQRTTSAFFPWFPRSDPQPALESQP
ncbi:MAG: DUF1295 domain-containing protein [Phycisphaerales bacterium]